MELIYICWYCYTFGLSLLIFEVLEMHQTRLYSSEDIALSGPKIKASPSPPDVPCHSLRLYVFLWSVMFAAWVICCCVLLLDAVSHNRVYCDVRRRFLPIYCRLCVFDSFGQTNPLTHAHPKFSQSWSTFTAMDYFAIPSQHKLKTQRKRSVNQWGVFVRFQTAAGRSSAWRH